MKLTLIKSDDTKSVEIVWIECNTPEGNFIIQKDHAETTLVLSDNKELMYCLKTGKQESFIVKRGGIVHITKAEIQVLISP